MADHHLSQATLPVFRSTPFWAISREFDSQMVIGAEVQPGRHHEVQKPLSQHIYSTGPASGTLMDFLEVRRQLRPGIEAKVAADK
jgi:hypothetical protein